MMDFRKIIRQTVVEARADKAYTSLYIGGVALSIMTVLIFAVIYYVKIAPLAPEVNRERTLYVDLLKYTKPDSTSSGMAMLSYRGVKEFIYELKNVEAASAKHDSRATVGAVGSKQIYEITTQSTDDAFFKIYDFTFLEGKPFSAADFQSGRKVAVITDRVARKVFGTSENVTGREFLVDGETYTVCGVIRQTSRLIRASFAEAFLPYTSVSGHDAPGWNPDAPFLGGGYGAVLLVKDDAQEKALRKEVAEFVRKHNAPADNWKLDLFNQPRTHVTAAFQEYPASDFSWTDVVIDNLAVLLALLLVPAINISAMIAGRIDSRISEMGIRKAFGARRRRLLSQVMWENFLFTLAGGAIALITAWIVLYFCRAWVFDLLLSSNEVVRDTTTITVTGDMIFAPAVFAATLALCIILNLLSAFIPAWRSLRHPIVSSINEKR